MTTKEERVALGIPNTCRLVPIWEHAEDEDGHAFWCARPGDRAGVLVNVWRAGGDSGDYLTEHGTRHPTLFAAKEEAQRRWEEP